MRNVLLVVVIPGMLAFAAEYTTAQDTETGHIDVATMRAKWRERQAAIQSLSISWRQKTSASQDSIQERAMRRRVATPPNERHNDDAKLAYEQRHTLVVAGERVSWRTTGFRPRGQAAGAGALRPISERRVFDGEKHVSFRFTEDADGKFPQAVLQRERKQLIADEKLFPILLNLLPLDADLKSLFDLTAFEPSGSTTIIADRKCFRLVSGKRAIWVAPDADYSIIRYAWMNDDLESASLATTIDVERSPEGIFTPTKWSTVKSGDWQSKIAVNNLEINPKIDDAEFSIIFPMDTLVIDQLAGNTKTSIVRADGSLFPVDKARTYKEALKLANSQDD
ncbi:MAG: hypothetical protein HY290_17805 [Planctomycetia bacterium]|nr:hypothetical protein [Planctomycetia bacterium]